MKLSHGWAMGRRHQAPPHLQTLHMDPAPAWTALRVMGLSQTHTQGPCSPFMLMGGAGQAPPELFLAGRVPVGAVAQELSPARVKMAPEHEGSGKDTHGITYMWDQGASQHLPPPGTAGGAKPGDHKPSPTPDVQHHFSISELCCSLVLHQAPVCTNPPVF